MYFSLSGFPPRRAFRDTTTYSQLQENYAPAKGRLNHLAAALDPTYCLGDGK